MYHNESDGHHALAQHYMIILHYVLPASIVLIIVIIILSSVAFVICNRSRKSGGTCTETECENCEDGPHLYETINPEIHAANVCYEVARINVAFNDAYISTNSLPKSVSKKSIPHQLTPKELTGDHGNCACKASSPKVMNSMAK